jgi:hypothetical protein
VCNIFYDAIPQKMKGTQLAAVIVVSITLALVTTVIIIMAVAWVKKPCAECPPCEETIANINVAKFRDYPPLPAPPELPPAPPAPPALPPAPPAPPALPPAPKPIMEYDDSVEMPRADFSFF